MGCEDDKINAVVDWTFFIFQSNQIYLISLT